MIATVDEFQKKLKLFQEHLAAAQRSASMLARFQQQLIVYYPFQIKDVDQLDADVEVVIYACFKKYEQLVVLLNDNLLKNLPYFEMENTAKMSRYDNISYAEKMGVVKSAKGFVDAVALRNQLAHEYPLDPVRQTALLNHVIVETEELLQAMQNLERFVQERLPIWSKVRQGGA